MGHWDAIGPFIIQTYRDIIRTHPDSGHQSDPHFASLYHMPPLQMVMQRKTVSWLQVFALQDKEYIEIQE